MASKGSAIGEWRTPIAILIGILVLGSIWGLSEVAVGGGLRAVGFPYRAGLLTGIGIGIMAVALAIYKKPAMLIGIGLTAVLFKLLAVPVVHLPVQKCANALVAVGLEVLAISLVAGLLMKRMDKSALTRMGAGALVALLAAISFFFIGMRVAPCSYLLSFSGNPVGFMAEEGLIWALFSAFLLPVGYLVGMKLQPKVAYMLTAKPRFSYAAGTTITAICAGATVAALMA